MAIAAKTKKERDAKNPVWAIIPDKDLKDRFYLAKAKKQEKDPGPLSDRDFHKMIIDEGLKKFGF